MIERESKTQATEPKAHDLVGRTLDFAKMTRGYAKSLPKSMSNIEYARQLVRSASSVGANYIEAQEALSKKDFLMRVKISRKEARESGYWIELSEPADGQSQAKCALAQEVVELTKILTAIILKGQEGLS